MDYQYVLLNIKNRLATVTVNRPEASGGLRDPDWCGTFLHCRRGHFHHGGNGRA